MRKKKALTLIEVVIALALTGILLGGLFNLYQRMGIAHAKIKALKRSVVPKHIMHQRLTRLFDSVLLTDSSIPLHTEQRKLYFTFYNSLDPEPLFSGILQGSLSLTSKGEILLTSISPKGQKREEFLLENVRDMRFYFYSSKEHVWENSWIKEKQESPYLLKMCWTPKGKEEKPVEIIYFMRGTQ